MPRYHNINGVRVQFTALEETARDAEEQVWRDGKLNRKLEALRETRNNLLAKTDWTANSDVTMSSAMATYRQQLRDAPNGLNTLEKIEAYEFPTEVTN